MYVTRRKVIGIKNSKVHNFYNLINYLYILILIVSTISVLIFISVTRSLSITLQTAGARVIQSMGEQVVFFKFTAQTSKKYKTPVNAILVQAFWAIVLMFSLNIRYFHKIQLLKITLLLNPLL